MIGIRSPHHGVRHTTAVADLSVAVRPGVVTGFLAPSRAGTSTTMRAIVGLDRPTSRAGLAGGRRGDGPPDRWGTPCCTGEPEVHDVEVL